MNWQIVVVAIIIFSALFFVGKNFWRKARSFSAKSDCGAGCGCEAKSRPAE
jgi:hypothetical protein